MRRLPPGLGYNDTRVEPGWGTGVDDRERYCPLSERVCLFVRHGIEL